ncbi:MAG: AraC family transcriptional regulator [Stygiobacter sp.]|nr:MAG: AraC family transcriptional regulator [Stygiobacter sp.]KAF0217054.1 MAG: AraC family transcriptional [Ignavibacteria bacterium]
MSTKHFQTISELHKAQGYPLPENPLFGLKQLKKTTTPVTVTAVSYDFYFICFKRLKTGNIWYGKTKYDNDRGFMYFMKPRQIISLHKVQLKGKGFSIEIHEDFLMGHPLFNEIKKYDFFDYETSEALHVTPREEKIMWSLFNKMESEYHNNPDEFSKTIILSHLDSILKYAQRFYKRQFIDRKPILGLTVTKFNECLNKYFVNGEVGGKGLPSVNYIASRLNLSPKYLSDLLKHETGKTALELIHLFVISEAKNMIVEGERSISEIAYQLGFENPPYFSRLFRKEVGMSPKEFKNHLLN